MSAAAWSAGLVLPWLVIAIQLYTARRVRERAERAERMLELAIAARWDSNLRDAFHAMNSAHRVFRLMSEGDPCPELTQLQSERDDAHEWVRDRLGGAQ